jgi:hypothetical protein
MLLILYIYISIEKLHQKAKIKGIFGHNFALKNAAGAEPQSDQDLAAGAEHHPAQSAEDRPPDLV